MDLMFAVHVLIGLLALASAPQARAATEQNLASSAVLMQGFHWNVVRVAPKRWYGTLASQSGDMKDLGVTHVWFPPPSKAAPTYEGYLPTQLDVLDSEYGSEAELKAAISAFAKQGISVVADLVLNHRGGDTTWADFSQPEWNCKAVVKDDDWCGGCGDNQDSGEGVPYARDLDHNSPTVQTYLKSFVSSRLKSVNFTGMRIDFAKGYSPSFVKIYHDAMSPNFCVAEYWSNLNYDKVDDHRQLLVNYVDGTAGQCGVFDFTTKGLLNRVLGSPKEPDVPAGEYWRLQDAKKKPQGGIGWWAQKMVTFVDNHDTGPSENAQAGQNHWPLKSEKVMEAYAYVLTHPGIPSVYYPHVYDWNLRDGIKALIQARKAAGINSTSSVVILAAENDLYAAWIYGSRGQVAIKMGSKEWAPSGWTLSTSGVNYAVWTCLASVTFTVSNASTSVGQSLRVVGNVTGNTDLLGNWTPARGFNLSIQGTGANAAWSGTLALPCGMAIQYKYVKWQDGKTAIWESDQVTSSFNREFTLARDSPTPVSRTDSFAAAAQLKGFVASTALVSKAAEPHHQCQMWFMFAAMIMMLARVEA